MLRGRFDTHKDEPDIRKTQELLAFIKQLPAGIAYAPIYAKGCKLQSGKESKGKTPRERSPHQSLNPADVVLQVERQPA